MSYLKKQYYKLIKKSPADMKMVRYWKTREACAAKVTEAEDGSIQMVMEGEDYPFPTFPRAHILFGKLSKLKHEIKNQIFNDSWYALEEGREKEEVIKNLKDKLFKEIPKYYEPLKFDVLPVNKTCRSVREIHRAWTKVSPETGVLRDYLCLILQEDDGYRMRVQWLAEWFGWAGWMVKLMPVRFFRKSLEMCEHGEVIGDMKERIRLLRRILSLVLEDKNVRKKFVRLFREIDWRKVRLTEADKYQGRGKYFKLDFKLFDY